MTLADFKNLQRLAWLCLSPEQEAKILPQMTSIIWFLGQLDKIVIDKNTISEKLIPMPIMSGIDSFPSPEKLLHNTKHTKTGNTISIKSFVEK